MGSLIGLVRAANANENLTAFERALLKFGKMLVLAFGLSALPVLLPAASAQSFDAAQWGTALHTALATGLMATLAAAWKYLSATVEEANAAANAASAKHDAADQKMQAAQAALDQAKDLHAQSLQLAQQSGVVPAAAVSPKSESVDPSGVGADAAVAVPENVGAESGTQEGEPAATNPEIPAIQVADSIPGAEPITAASLPAVTVHLPVVDFADATTVKVTPEQKAQVSAAVEAGVEAGVAVDEQPTQVLPVELVRTGVALDASNPAL